ncbi:putative methyltransferase NSUN7 [Dissostichus eleginoides]|uniref:Methyltransferase NSUN7 n=1 Tax=Dissostichus eleginoides TaxID=100907 RepID=A0AAD9BPK8_DISEL|nr:putative methyltransferase NSUN7 [Dissostichus eleginoides]
MSCVAPVRTILNDKDELFVKVGSSVDVTEEIFVPPQDHKEPISFLLPHLPSSLPIPDPLPSDQVYLQAAAIFQQLRADKPVTQQALRYGKKMDTPLPDSGRKNTQRQSYQLAFNTLKYRDLLEDIIADSCFHTSQHISSDLLPLAMVMLFDFQDRSVDEVCAALQRAGLCEVEIMTALSEGSFCRDPLCPDTLVFSPQLHALLQHSSLTSTHALNTQDRSVCVAVSALRPLLFDNGDVLAVGSFSAVTVAHIAVAAADRSGRVLVCDVRVLSEAFSGLDEWDASVQRLKVIIVLPQCSSSALNDPVSTMHSEHGNWDLLPELCHSSVSRSKIHTMASQQARLLAHAVSFPKVQTVVYCTRSVYPEENEQLVKRVLGKTHTHPKLLPFRVNGPIFSDDSQSGDTTESKFFRLETSQFTNGCFIARLSRQADPTKVETVHDVLARAAAKGLLGGIIPELSKTNKKGKSKKNRAASPSSKPSSPSGREGQLGEGEKPVAPSQHEEKKGEDVEEEKEEDEGGKRKKGLKGSKRKVKGRTKQTNRTTAPKHQPNSNKKKSDKVKVSQSHHKRRPTKTKRRRIPRLTLTLISSAKPSRHLSPITALAHKLSNNATIQSQQNVFSPPPSAPPAASKQVQRLNPEPEGAEKTLKHTVRAESPFKVRGKVEGKVRPKEEEATEEVLTHADFVLPPISSPSCSSVSSRSGSSLSQRPTRTPHSQHAQICASSSSIYLPGL